MQHQSHALRRGAVLLVGKHTWLVWTVQPGAAPVCMPIKGQHEPLGRLDYIVQAGDSEWLDGQRLVVRIAGVRVVPTGPLTVIISHISDDALGRIQRQLNRVADTIRLERATVAA